MFHRTVRTIQRVTRSAHQYAHVDGYTPQSRPLHFTTRLLHDDSDALPSSQDPSQASPYQSWSIDKINVLQSDMAMTKVQLDHLKESTDTKIDSLQIDLENNFAKTISALDSKLDSKFDKVNLKFDKVDSKFQKIDSQFQRIDSQFQRIDSQFEKVDSRFEKIDSRLDALGKDMKHIVVELKAELGKQLAEHKVDMGRYDLRLVWRVFFAVVSLTAVAVGGATTVFMRDRLLPRQTPHVEEK